MGHPAFSTARAWRPAAGYRLPRTLGVALHYRCTMLSLQDWFTRKTQGKYLRLAQRTRATEEWKRSTGRQHFARVTLEAEPAETFEFRSELGAWQSQQSKEEFEHYVLEGVVAELLLRNAAPPILGFRIVLTAAVVDSEASNGNAFFMAAKAATAKLLQGVDGEPHGNYARSDA